MFKFWLLVLVIEITNAIFIGESNVYDIKWSENLRHPIKDELEKFNITSSMGEKYTCAIAKNDEITQKEAPYKGPLAVEFIEHLFNKGICSYRLDPYWTYELCHGKHIRQYHEILDDSMLMLQQYTLGRMGTKEREMVIRRKKEEERRKMQNSTHTIKTKRVDNRDLPFVEIAMTEGSVCEHNKRKLRRSNVYYICDMKGNHDIHTVKEVTSCVYEIIISTPLLCAHPKYRPKRIAGTTITCYAKEKSPKVPYNLAKIYWERKRIIENAARGEGRMEFITYDKNSNVDNLEVGDFLSGKNCISGGTGNWRFEFCYGRYINQYTYGILGIRTTICLGKFNLNKHLEWIRSRPYKRPKPLGYRTYITQFYTDGSVSNITGRPRQTEVKLKCIENTTHKDALVMYLHEINFGKYLLGIESPILCQVVPKADEDGLVFYKS
ncbi:endoplasmic reticulum lectin 1-like [Harmonia axyridis]|uniref:endoplasmic reticulum lectin 1-like n=1 Tax=Harmonia axyridis TaxID=115357 RepID=UPI001E27783D|nr:endoplasmic reticulum lectin 1-like [Harmonia axyridis]